jgi:DNA-3-methyladenine glycosylase
VRIPKPLPRGFYERSVLQVAPDCLGMLLVHQLEREILISKIVEVEAYRGPSDRAAHSYGGRRTARTEVMFGKAGMAYVFLIYGIHHHFNIVTGGIDEPEAVLIRAVEPLHGFMSPGTAMTNAKTPSQLTNGPGKLCKAMKIDRQHSGADLCKPPLYIAQGTAPCHVRRTPRIGIDYAGAWATRPWRWLDSDSPFVSQQRGVTRKK